MIDREHDLPITKQAQVLHISRGSVYYLPRLVSATDLEVMRRLDRLHLELPFAGSRMLQGLLVAEGHKIGRRHVKTLMRRMEIEALYRRPRTTKPEPGHKIYPYLLRGMAITRPNQVWAMDITYIPMARGFVYLAVVLDWFSRRVQSALRRGQISLAFALTASRVLNLPRSQHSRNDCAAIVMAVRSPEGQGRGPSTRIDRPPATVKAEPGRRFDSTAKSIVRTAAEWIAGNCRRSVSRRLQTPRNRRALGHGINTDKILNVDELPG